MPESKFTSGPWIFDVQNIVKDFDSGYGIYTDPYTTTIVHVPCSIRTETALGVGVPEANARLIAAAPDMYEALKILERIVTELYPGHIEPYDEHMEEYKAVWSATMNARAVLAKAEGNSHA
jgi:hypothetical protein